MDYTIQYYDLVLVAIAASMAVGALIGVVTPVSFSISVPLLGLVAIAIVGHALFVNGPVDEFEDLAEQVDVEELPGAGFAAQVAD